jgi:hypothetical protein
MSAPRPTARRAWQKGGAGRYVRLPNHFRLFVRQIFDPLRHTNQPPTQNKTKQNRWGVANRRAADFGTFATCAASEANAAMERALVAAQAAARAGNLRDFIAARARAQALFAVTYAQATLKYADAAGKDLAAGRPTDEHQVWLLRDAGACWMLQMRARSLNLRKPTKHPPKNCKTTKRPRATRSSAPSSHSSTPPTARAPPL